MRRGGRGRLVRGVPGHAGRDCLLGSYIGRPMVRRERRQHQAGVAAYFGVSDVTIHRWETGKAPITVENFVLLAKLFHAETPGHLLFPPHAAKRAAVLREANVIADRMSADDLRRWLDIGISLAHKTSDQATGEAAD